MNRLASESNAVLWRVRLENKGRSAKTVPLSIFWKGTLGSEGVARFHDRDHSMDVAYEFFDQATVSQATKNPEEVESYWKIHLLPGASQEVRFQMCVSTGPEQFAKAQTKAPEWFELQWSRAKAVWEERWMAKAVIGLYVPGQGVCCSLHRDGTRVEMRHCYDFASIGRFMPADLHLSVRKEMVAFVQRELLTDRWMRAQSLLDVAAATSDRPDHGPMGAYDAWPAVTVDAMCNLGHWSEGVAFLRRTQAAIYESVYAQAR